MRFTVDYHKCERFRKKIIEEDGSIQPDLGGSWSRSDFSSLFLGMPQAALS